MPLIHPFSLNCVLFLIQTLLEHRHHLLERQRALPLEEDSLHSVYGPQKSQSLLKELTLAFRTREELYEKLLQRKAHLQVCLPGARRLTVGSLARTNMIQCRLHVSSKPVCVAI